MPSIDITKNRHKNSQPENMSLREAVDMGEYDPEYLERFSEWSTLSHTIQWNMINRALNIRENQLVKQWAEVNNIIDFRLKPELKVALKNLEEKRHKLMDDREKLLLHYSKL